MPIYRGAKRSLAIQFKDRSSGQPIDITTWQFRATMKNEDDEEVLEMTTALGHFTVFDGPNGWVRWMLTPAQTAALEAGAVSFGLYRIDEADGPTRLGRCVDQVREAD